MRIHKQKWNILGRRILVLLLLCGFLLPFLQQTSAVSVTYEYKWIKDHSGLPTDDQWHDYFIAWEDLDDKNKVWFTDYHWYTPDGDNNIDVGGSSWMEYKAASTLPDHKSERFSSRDSLGHMQIKYAGRDKDNDNSPMYYIRLTKMNGGYSYFTAHEPSNKAYEAEAFTFEDHGDVFHIFVNISGKADRYLTRDGQYLETSYSHSIGAGEHYRPMRVYQRTFTVNKAEEGTIGKDVIGKVTLYEYHWVNTTEELLELANGSSQWQDVFLAWNGGYMSNGKVYNDSTLWYTKEIWEDNGSPNYKNEYIDDRFSYWSNTPLGTGYTSKDAESFVLPEKLGHFQIKHVGWDKDNAIKGATAKNGKKVESPEFQIRFSVGPGQELYLGKYDFSSKSSDARSYTFQLFVEESKKNNSNYYYGYSHVFQNLPAARDEYLARNGNRMALQEYREEDDWQYYFRIYACRTVEYDAIVKSFTVGNGTTYSIDSRLILNEGVTITVENGGVLMVDKQLLNNGNIVVNKGGTVIVNEGGYIMAYGEKMEGNITLNGGNLIIMDNAKVLCDYGDGTLLASNGSTIVNRGLLVIGKIMELRNSSYLKNEAGGALLMGATVNSQRGAVGSLTTDQIFGCVTNRSFTFLSSTKSKLLNRGIISVYEGANTTWNPGGENSFTDQGQFIKRK